MHHIKFHDILLLVASVSKVLSYHRLVDSIDRCCWLSADVAASLCVHFEAATLTYVRIELSEALVPRTIWEIWTISVNSPVSLICASAQAGIENPVSKACPCLPCKTRNHNIAHWSTTIENSSSWEDKTRKNNKEGNIEKHRNTKRLKQALVL